MSKQAFSPNSSIAETLQKKKTHLSGCILLSLAICSPTFPVIFKEKQASTCSNIVQGQYKPWGKKPCDLSRTCNLLVLCKQIALIKKLKNIQ